MHTQLDKVIFNINTNQPLYADADKQIKGALSKHFDEPRFISQLRVNPDTLLVTYDFKQKASKPVESFPNDVSLVVRDKVGRVRSTEYSYLNPAQKA